MKQIKSKRKASVKLRKLVGCSLKKVKKKKIKIEERSSLITTITKTITKSISIRVITPPEEPNTHLTLYLCIHGRLLHPLFRWCKIDLANDGPQTNNSKANPTILSPICYMPETIPRNFRAVPTKQKLVYALGGQIHRGEKWVPTSKALVCDFGSSTCTPVWEEIPRMCSPLVVSIGVASPLDGKLYAFGETEDATSRGDAVVFDPSLKSWAPSDKTYPHDFYAIDDYLLLPHNELAVFETNDSVLSFNFTTGRWDRYYEGHVPSVFPRKFRSSAHLTSSVAVGHIIYKFYYGKLYALDLNGEEPISFKLVHGLESKLPKYLQTVIKAHIFYIGKGKLCLVWGVSGTHRCYLPIDHDDKNEIYITCLKFWVGMCSRRKRLCAVTDRCEQYITQGYKLYDCFAF